MTGRTTVRTAARRWSVVAAVAVTVMALMAPLAASQSSQPDDGIVLPGGELPAAAPAPATTPRKSFDLSGPPLIDAAARGVEAPALDEATLAEAAARNGMSPAELESLLETDDTIRLDANGIVFFVEPVPDAEQLAALGEETVAPGPFPYNQTFKLHSKKGSQRTIYLDFTGHTVSGTAWQLPVIFGGVGISDPYTAAPFDTDGNPGAFSNAELDAIQSIWQRVSEDFAPFEVNVTTQQPSAATLKRSSVSDEVYGTRLVITNAFPYCVGQCGGVAYLFAFNAVGAEHDYYQPGWCFPDQLSNNTKIIAECASHEVGHNLGLQHDGFGSQGYYLGHNPWAPIMGAGYYQPVTQWSKGEYTGANQTQDDFAVMASTGVLARTDDHANNTAGATVLRAGATGTITSQDDYDTFAYAATTSGPVTFTATPGVVSPNLDIRLDLYDANGSPLASNAPAVVRVNDDVASNLNAAITHSVTAGAVYYLQVSGDSYLTPQNGYSRYGSIGPYTVAASVAGAGVCNGKVATISGAPGNVNETINGTPGNDVIFADGGNDIINGGAGNDTICGGGGNDTINGGAGNDTIIGGGGTDTVTYSNAPSAVTVNLKTGKATGGGGSDTISSVENVTGSKFNDKLAGNAGANVLKGGAGNDTLSGDAGNDTLNGEAGNDVLNGAAGNDTLSGGSGNDTVNGGSGTDKLSGGSGNDTLKGGSGNDTITGEAGTDKLWGEAGADSLKGGDGKDTLDGGDGNDKLWGDAGNDTLKGGAGNDELRGGGGNDTLTGGGGVDKLWGGAGKDELRGGGGNDTLNGEAGADKLWGDAGKDTLNGGGGNDQLRGGAGNDTLNGGAGADKLWGEAGKDKLNGGGGSDTCNGGGGIDTASACEVKFNIP